MSWFNWLVNMAYDWEIVVMQLAACGIALEFLFARGKTFRQYPPCMHAIMIAGLIIISQYLEMATRPDERTNQWEFLMKLIFLLRTCVCISATVGWACICANSIKTVWLALTKVFAPYWKPFCVWFFEPRDRRQNKK